MHWPNEFSCMSSFGLVCNLFHKLTEIMVELFKTQLANTHFFTNICTDLDSSVYSGWGLTFTANANNSWQQLVFFQKSFSYLLITLTVKVFDLPVKPFSLPPRFFAILPPASLKFSLVPPYQHGCGGSPWLKQEKEFIDSLTGNLSTADRFLLWIQKTGRAQ